MKSKARAEMIVESKGNKGQLLEIRMSIFSAAPGLFEGMYKNFKERC